MHVDACGCMCMHVDICGYVFQGLILLKFLTLSLCILLSHLDLTMLCSNGKGRTVGRVKLEASLKTLDLNRKCSTFDRCR